MSRYRDLVEDVVARPQLIIRGLREEKKAIRWLSTTHLGPKFLVVVYRRHNDEKAIITAYFTSDLKEVKGEIEWKA